MKKDFVAGLKPETTVHTSFLVQSRERKIANNGNAYLDVSFRDSTGVIIGKIWDCDRFKLEFEPGDVVLVDGTVDEYRGAPQLRVRRITRCAPEEFDLRDFLPRSARDPEEMFAELISRLARMPGGPIRELLMSLMNDPAMAEKYKLAPAATSYHHAYLGGLLEHVLSLMALGDKVCDHYQWLDRDLVLAGLVLHDLGKIEELSFSRGFTYTTRGQLLGHITIGLEIVSAKIRQFDNFPGTLRDRIEHLMLSHHGKLEFGSPKEPMFPEALLVHYLDDMDSKLASMVAQFATDKERTGDFTARNRALGRELLKPSADEVPGPGTESQSRPASPGERRQLELLNDQKKS